MNYQKQRFRRPQVRFECYPDDLLSQLQSTLAAALADVEFEHDVLREKFAALPATADREALLLWLDRKRDEERKPLQERLAELRARALNAATAHDLPLAS